MHVPPPVVSHQILVQLFNTDNDRKLTIGIDKFTSYLQLNLSSLDSFSKMECITFLLEIFGISFVIPTSEVDTLTYYKDQTVSFVVDAFTIANQKDVPFFIEQELKDIFASEITELSPYLLLGLFSLTSEYPDSLDRFFIFYIKILEYWEPSIKSLALSSTLWLIDALKHEFRIEVGDRWKWILNDILLKSTLHYFDMLEILRPSAYLYLKLHDGDSLELLERFLITLSIGTERYKPTESWMINFIFNEIKKTTNLPRLALLGWPSWCKFFSRASSNIPAMETHNHLLALEILETILTHSKLNGFFKSYLNETAKIVTWLILWNVKESNISKKISFVYKLLADVSLLDENLVIEELEKINPTLVSTYEQLRQNQ